MCRLLLWILLLLLSFFHFSRCQLIFSLFNFFSSYLYLSIGYLLCLEYNTLLFILVFQYNCFIIVYFCFLSCFFFSLFSLASIFAIAIAETNPLANRLLVLFLCTLCTYWWDKEISKQDKSPNTHFYMALYSRFYWFCGP